MGIYVIMWGYKYTCYIHVYIYICMYDRQTYKSLYIGRNVYMYIHTHYIHVCIIDVYICMHIGIDVCRQTCMGIHLCMYVHKYTN